MRPARTRPSGCAKGPNIRKPERQRAKPPAPGAAPEAAANAPKLRSLSLLGLLLKESRYRQLGNSKTLRFQSENPCKDGKSLKTQK